MIIKGCLILLFAVYLSVSVLYRYLKLGRQAYVLSTCNGQSTTSQDAKIPKTDPTSSKSIQWYWNLYFQLQNLENHPSVLESARDELLAMFSRALSSAHRNTRDSILSFQHYDATEIQHFIKQEQERVMDEWCKYLERRKQGHGPELFATTEAAKAWLIQQAPVKLVDGAWLAHIHKITTPFALRDITKHAWQVLSEELGDGDLQKNHVHLYRHLLEELGCSLPESHSPEFIEPHQWDDVENRCAWEAAVGQLIISLFPNEFLPEILGFSMHYELVTMDTLRAAYELKNLGINPNYFLIHVAIDNADSGHAAMATHTVIRYLDMVRSTGDEKTLERTWKRVQAGYVLSQALGVHASHGQEISDSMVEEVDFETSRISLNARIIEIFQAKALVSYKCHLQSRARIGGRSLSEWLSPSMWTHPSLLQRQKLLKELSKATPWIYAGDSSKSLLVRELQWNGRMFGAFTQNEVAVLTQWIESFGPGRNACLYWNFTDRSPVASKDAIAALHDPASHHPVVSFRDAHELGTPSCTLFSKIPDWNLDSKLAEQQAWVSTSYTRLPDLVGLWFAHIGLLESTITTPSRTISPVYASIVRLLRAQHGFTIETDIIAGTDEMKRPSCPSLVDIGLELVARAGWATETKISCLKDVLLLTKIQGQGEHSARLAEDMLRWATRPIANLGWLLGMDLAFLRVKEAAARAPDLLGYESRILLGAIVARERQSLVDCARWLETMDTSQYKRLRQGYQFGTVTLRNCLSQEVIA